MTALQLLKRTAKYNKPEVLCVGVVLGVSQRHTTGHNEVIASVIGTSGTPMQVAPLRPVTACRIFPVPHSLLGGLGWVWSTPPPDAQAYSQRCLPCATQLGWTITAVTAPRHTILMTAPETPGACAGGRYRHACVCGEDAGGCCRAYWVLGDHWGGGARLYSASLATCTVPGCGYRRVPPSIGHHPQVHEGSARHRAPPTSHSAGGGPPVLTTG